MSNVTDINSRVDLDLDAEEARLPTRPDYFITRKGTVAGDDGQKVETTKRIRITDPNKVDWRILVTLEENVELLGHIIPDEVDKVFLRDNAIPVELLLVLMKKLEEHFKTLPELGGGRKQLPI